MLLKHAPTRQKNNEQSRKNEDNQRLQIKRAIFKAAAKAEADLVAITCQLRSMKSQ